MRGLFFIHVHRFVKALPVFIALRVVFYLYHRCRHVGTRSLFSCVGTHEFFVCHMVCIIYMWQAVVHECQQKFYKPGYVLVLVCSSLQTCHRVLWINNYVSSNEILYSLAINVLAKIVCVEDERKLFPWFKGTTSTAL